MGKEKVILIIGIRTRTSTYYMNITLHTNTPTLCIWSMIHQTNVNVYRNEFK